MFCMACGMAVSFGFLFLVFDLGWWVGVGFW